MSIRTNVPSSPARATSRATFSYAVSSSKESPRCVSLSAMFALSCSATRRSAIRSYSSVTAAAPASSGIASPSSVVFAYSPASFSPRRTRTHSSSVSPATNRPAPSRRPWRWTRCCSRSLSAACRIAARGNEDTVAPRSLTRREPTASGMARLTRSVQRRIGRHRREHGERAALAPEHVAPEPVGIAREDVLGERGLDDP